MIFLYDVIVIGGGHAGVEAALASARLGCKTLMLTMSIENIGLMPCNPSIGGPAKGQIVGEIDALGGMMGSAADATHIQLKVLNRSRGPAVQCLRSQNDKFDYNAYVRQTVLSAPGLDVKQEEVQRLMIENNRIHGVVSKLGHTYQATCVVMTTGTFLKGLMHVGLSHHVGGRVDEPSSDTLSEDLSLYFKLGRLKTGTPPRLDAQTIDYQQMSLQPGDPEFLHFSFRTENTHAFQNQLPCYLTRTTSKTHEIILANLDRSPMYAEGKKIKGLGPRYCPSIEDKVVRFKDKDHHQIFIEPEGRQTNSIYPQGLNTSLPADVQLDLLRSMPGLSQVQVLRYGYAVEYDFVYPDQLGPTLETKRISGLFLAGQINGTSGYEEAAGQGLVAGINAGLKVLKRPPLILTRENTFIGTLIDDLITKPILEPYRMLTSRSEYRLLLRQDNATHRLSELGFSLGLLSLNDISRIRDQHQRVEGYLQRWKKTSVPFSVAKGFGLTQAIPMAHFVKRPDVTLEVLTQHEMVDRSDSEFAQKALVELKYEGYIQKQTQEIQKLRAFESRSIPKTLNFDQIKGLKTESRHRFKQHQPATIYEAKRIAGINPADIVVLMAYLQKTGF